MYVLKGFANHALFANNTPGANSVIGEISNQSLTYSREVGQYTDPIAADVTLISFLSALDGTAQAIATDFKTRTLTVIEWIYQKALTNGGQMSAAQFLEDILTQFQASAVNFACGQIVVANDQAIPEWVSWKDIGGQSPTDNFVKIWFVDASFAVQYDEYTILVVPPITPLDDFFKTGSMVEAALKARTLPQAMTQAQAAKGGFPETILRAETYTYHDPQNTQRLVPSDWLLLIYGVAGNNIDAIKDALVDYILNNSTHTRDEWMVILPDIFRRTEFVIVPNFGKYSIPQNTVRAGIYSPIISLVNARALLGEYAPDYDSAHIDSHATVQGHVYKSLALPAIGSAENRDNLFQLDDVFPDYIMVASTSTDFNRMSQATQEWSALLSSMLEVAESMGPFTSLPDGMTRLTRNGKLFVVATYDNIHYLVAAKFNFPDPDQ